MPLRWLERYGSLANSVQFFFLSDEGALPVLRAIDAFAQAEDQRWAQLRAGSLPPIQRSPEEQLDELIPQGYRLIQAQQTVAACDVWLAAWDLVKQLTHHELRSPADLNDTYGLTYSVDDWSVDLVWELGNAGFDNPVYSEHQLRVSRECLELFPDQIADTVVNLMRAQGEALWRLGPICIRSGASPLMYLSQGLSV